jgi:hypothetical protein
MGLKPSRASATSPGSRLPSGIGVCNARDAPPWLLQARSEQQPTIQLPKIGGKKTSENLRNLTMPRE